MARRDEQATAGRHVTVGPSQPESSQLIDICGDKMKMVAEAYTEPEPHFAQILKVKRGQPIEVYPRRRTRIRTPFGTRSRPASPATGNQVVAKVIAIRSRFVSGPDRRAGGRRAHRARHQRRANPRHDSRLRR